MTGYTVHTGSNEKFTGGWDRIFTGEEKKTKNKKTKKKPAVTTRKKSKKKT